MDDRGRVFCLEWIRLLFSGRVSSLEAVLYSEKCHNVCVYELVEKKRGWRYKRKCEVERICVCERQSGRGERAREGGE